MPKASLHIIVEEKDFSPPITMTFEKHMLFEQARGKLLLAFSHIDDTTFRLYFGAVYKDSMAVVHDLNNVKVGPWCLYSFHEENPNVQEGDHFEWLKLVEDFCDVMGVGDAVQIVDIATMQPIGTASITHLYKSKIRDLNKVFIKRMYPRLKDRAGVVQYLSEAYDHEVTLDTVVAVIGLRATSKFGHGRTGTITERLLAGLRNIISLGGRI